MTAQPRNRFVFCVVVVEFAVNGNQAFNQLRNWLIGNHAKPGLKPLLTTTTTNFELKQSDSVGRMTAQAHNRFGFSVVVAEFTVRPGFH